MFLNYIKEIFVKKSLKNDLHNVKTGVFTSNMQTIGLLIDESNFHHSKELTGELILQGIASENITVVAYRDKLEKKKEYSIPTFGKKDVNWKAEITADFLNQFTETEFDLLISYYDIEKINLMLVTHKSKAKFKAGFSSVDKNLNQLMIDTTLEEYKLFISELFKYLRSIK